MNRSGYPYRGEKGKSSGFWTLYWQFQARQWGGKLSTSPALPAKACPSAVASLWIFVNGALKAMTKRERIWWAGLWRIENLCFLFMAAQLHTAFVLAESNTQLYTMAVLSRSVMSDFLWPCGLYTAWLLCPRGFSRQGYWSALSCPPPGDLPNTGTEPRSPAWQANSLPSEPPGLLVLFSGKTVSIQNI